MQLKVFKYEGAANDFVALDNRTDLVPEGDARQQLVKALCDRRRGIGADGVLMIEPRRSDATDFRMRYYNSDGSEGEMCGNGARCIARFANLIGAAGPEMTFDTEAGTYRASASETMVVVSFPDIETVPTARPLDTDGESFDADYLEAGVPHLVVWTNDARRAPVAEQGPKLRFHEALAPRGANVNFVSPDPAAPEHLLVRTYERGVEEETQACGTGSVASAVCWAQRRGLTGAQTIAVVPTSGDTLEIGFTLEENAVRAITLGGPAHLVFETTWEV